MINLEPIIVAILLCSFYGWCYYLDSERRTLKRFIFGTLIVAIIFVALISIIFFVKFLFKELPDWLAFSAFLIICVGSLGSIVIFFCRGIIQELLEEGKPITGFYLIFTILCILFVTWILVDAEVIPTWFGWALTILLSVDRCFAFFIYRHDKKIYEDSISSLLDDTIPNCPAFFSKMINALKDVAEKPTIYMEIDVLKHHIKDFLKSLTKTEKAIVVLYYHEEMMFTEIAMSLDLPAETVVEMLESIISRCNVYLHEQELS
jgi:hypothetical protein